jgi:hypothetical protein
MIGRNRLTSNPESDVLPITPRDSFNSLNIDTYHCKINLKCFTLIEEYPNNEAVRKLYLIYLVDYLILNKE